MHSSASDLKLSYRGELNYTSVPCNSKKTLNQAGLYEKNLSEVLNVLILKNIISRTDNVNYRPVRLPDTSQYKTCLVT